LIFASSAPSAIRSALSAFRGFLWKLTWTDLLQQLGVYWRRRSVAGRGRGAAATNSRAEAIKTVLLGVAWIVVPVGFGYQQRGIRLPICD